MDKGNKWRDKEFNAGWSVGEGRRNKGGNGLERGFILREGRKDFGESLSIERVEFTVEFTVHRGAAEVLGSEG
jgi:hypothetical protein